MESNATRPLAIVTGASSGIGYHLACQAAEHGYDLLLAADQLQRAGKDMRARGRGRILVTGSIAGFMPGSFQAVYSGSKAFVDLFTAALRNQMKDTGVTLTCLMPGVTDVVAGLKNKLQVAMAKVMPSQLLAEQHRKMAEPGTADKG